MADVAPPAANANANPNGNANQGNQWTTIMWRMVMMWMLYNFFFKSSSKPQPTTVKDADGKTITLPPHSNLYVQGQSLQLFVYLSEQTEFDDFRNQSALIWNQKGITYDWNESNNRDQVIEFATPEILKNNGTVYAHVYFKRVAPSDSYSFYIPGNRDVYGYTPLNKYLLHKEVVKKSLLGDEAKNTSEGQDDKKNEGRVLNFWKNNMTLHLITDHTVFPRGSVPPTVIDSMNFTENGEYLPILYFDDFWLLKDAMMIVNDTVDTLTLTLSYSPLSLFRWQIMLQTEMSFSMHKSMGTAGEGDDQEMKRMMMETNPYLLGVTMVVTLLHSVFDFLAFKNDITFWKNRKTVEGISVRTMLINFVLQIIIFLYLMDNDTSWVILISSGVGLGIEAWKISKAVIIEVDRTRWIPIKLKDRESYSSKTREHDETAMRYLSYVAYPLIVGYAIYSLIYDTHKSWYSWILNSLVGCVYTFGFIMMTPQLFINYKLKSVAHLPWKTFMYKALNTFIDDLFAFIIKMPTLHRLSCFRDDFIFLIYLYQRWIYPTDYRRVNEFGQGGDDKPDDASTASGSGDASVVASGDAVPRLEGASDQNGETKKDQ